MGHAWDHFPLRGGYLVHHFHGKFYDLWHIQIANDNPCRDSNLFHPVDRRRVQSPHLDVFWLLDQERISLHLGNLRSQVRVDLFGRAMWSVYPKPQVKLCCRLEVVAFQQFILLLIEPFDLVRGLVTADQRRNQDEA